MARPLYEVYHENMEITRPCFDFIAEDLAVGNLALEFINASAGSAGLKEHKSRMVGLLICRCADNFDNYLSSMLAEIYLHNPTLRLEKLNNYIQEGKTELSLPENDAVLYGIQRFVGIYSNKPFFDLNKYIHEQTGFTLANSDEDLNDINYISAYRNVIVHNNARVDFRFKWKMPDYQGEVGTRLDLMQDKTATSRLTTLMKIVLDIDERSSQFFNIKRSNICPFIRLEALS